MRMGLDVVEDLGVLREEKGRERDMRERRWKPGRKTEVERERERETKECKENEEEEVLSSLLFVVMEANIIRSKLTLIQK